MTAREPPVSSTSRALRAGGASRSSVPWMASSGPVSRRHQSSMVAWSGRGARLSATSTAPLVSSAQPTPSSTAFVENRSVKHWPRKNHAKSS
jgi:hypothetical protein